MGLLGARIASAATLSLTGTLANPNAAFVQGFRLASSGSLLIQTYGYGGSANAPGGANGAGAVIGALGFDPYVSLFRGIGPGALFLASNDDGACGPGAGAVADGNCFDSTLSLPALAAGDYTLALTLPSNFSFAENLGTGSLGDGFIGLAAEFGRVSAQPAFFAVDLVTAGAISPVDNPVAAVPEPASLVLLGFGLVALARVRHRRWHGFHPR